VTRHRQLRVLSIATLVLALVLLASAAQAGLKDRLKKKVEDKAGQKTDQAADKALGGAGDAAGGEGNDAGEGSGTETSDGESGSDAKVSEVSTKFDFVPGDKVLFMDDFTQDELGEFPAKWKLVSGTHEVAEMKGGRWLRCVSNNGSVRMKLPAMSALPEFWTLEFDFYGVNMGGAIGLTVDGVSQTEKVVWEARFPYSGNHLNFWTGDINSMTPLENGPIEGRHHVMFMARGRAIKTYLDRQRMASVPEISSADGVPTNFEFLLASAGKPMISNVRFAEGCRPAKDLLAEGKLVTYGIHFASGSDVVQPESAPVLRQIASYLEANAAVKLQITGHTDNTGTAAGNLDLSKRRAASVANVLSGEFKIAADRFTTDGKGDTQTVASNANAEGRAMNRRVEFTKL